MGFMVTLCWKPKVINESSQLFPLVSLTHFQLCYIMFLPLSLIRLSALYTTYLCLYFHYLFWFAVQHITHTHKNVDIFLRVRSVTHSLINPLF